MIPAYFYTDDWQSCVITIVVYSYGGDSSGSFVCEAHMV